MPNACTWVGRPKKCSKCNFKRIAEAQSLSMPELNRFNSEGFLGPRNYFLMWTPFQDALDFLLQNSVLRNAWASRLSFGVKAN